MTRTQVANLFRADVSDVSADLTVVQHNKLGLTKDNCEVFTISHIDPSVFRGRSSGSLSSRFEYFMLRNLVTDSPKYDRFVANINKKPRQHREICVVLNKRNKKNKMIIADGKHLIHALVSGLICFPMFVSVKFYVVDMSQQQYRYLLVDLYGQYNNKYKSTPCHKLLEIDAVKQVVSKAQHYFSGTYSSISIRADNNSTCSNSGMALSVNRLLFYATIWAENRSMSVGAGFNINPRRTMYLARSTQFDSFANSADTLSFFECLDKILSTASSHLYSNYRNIRNGWTHLVAGGLGALARIRRHKDRLSFINLVSSNAISFNLDVAIPLISRFEGSPEPYNIWAQAWRDTITSNNSPDSHGVSYDKTGKMADKGTSKPNSFIFRYTNSDVILRGRSASNPSNTFESCMLEYNINGYPLYI